MARDLVRARPNKVRITTMIDRDLLMWLKVRSLDSRMGYQTLLNQVLSDAAAREAKTEQIAEPARSSLGPTPLYDFEQLTKVLVQSIENSIQQSLNHSLKTNSPLKPKAGPKADLKAKPKSRAKAKPLNKKASKPKPPAKRKR